MTFYYHGPRNPLTDEYNPSKVADLFNSISSSIHCVRGNCDAEVGEMISNFPFLDHYSFQFHGYHFYCTHGHVYHLGHLPDEKVDFLIYGHYHVGFIKQENGVYYVNSGSVSLPKRKQCSQLFVIRWYWLILERLRWNGYRFCIIYLIRRTKFFFFSLCFLLYYFYWRGKL